MNKIFAPGCALMIDKPHLAEKIFTILNQNLTVMERLDICCRNHPALPNNTQVVNVCPGCDRRYRENYPGVSVSTISLWEILAESDFFPFPNYQGQLMSIIDACPTRNQARVQQAIRTLLCKMNIRLIEPPKTGTESLCCGDSFWGILPIEQVKQKMIRCVSEIPGDDVAVYCVSCAKSVFTGGKKPHYMVDLLFQEETLPRTYKPDDWHRELDDYVRNH